VLYIKQEIFPARATSNATIVHVSDGNVNSQNLSEQ